METTVNAPDVFAPYELRRELGRGAMGVVYEAQHRATGALRALKILPEPDDPSARERFAREAEALARLNHPQVVRLHEARLAGPHPWIAEDLLEGGNLAERLEQGPLPPAEASALVAKLARGVAAAHAAGVLHRDLKPENVLFDERDEPVLTDFGLARLTGGARLTRTNTLLGTPAFMAPEQARDPRLADERADVYGLGALLYACLTARPPFEGPLHGVLDAVQHRAPPPPSGIVPTVPAALEALCLAALAKDPAARPESARALAEALESAVRNEGGRARRRWLPLAVAAALLLVATAATARVALRRRRAAAAGRQAEFVRLRQGIAAAERKRLSPSELTRLEQRLDALVAANPSRETNALRERLLLLRALDDLLAGRRDAVSALRLRLGSAGQRLLDRVVRATAPKTAPEEALDLLDLTERKAPGPRLRVLRARVRARALDLRTATAFLAEFAQLPQAFRSPDLRAARLRALLLLDRFGEAFAALAEEPAGGVPSEGGAPVLRGRIEALELLPSFARACEAEADLAAAVAGAPDRAGGPFAPAEDPAARQRARDRLARLHARFDLLADRLLPPPGEEPSTAGARADAGTASACRGVAEALVRSALRRATAPRPVGRPLSAEALAYAVRALELAHRTAPSASWPLGTLRPLLGAWEDSGHHHPLESARGWNATAALVSPSDRPALLCRLPDMVWRLGEREARSALLPLAREALRGAADPAVRSRTQIALLRCLLASTRPPDHAEGVALASKFLHAAASGAQRAELLYLRGRLLAEQGAHADAIASYEAALRRQPGNSTTQQALLRACRASGRGEAGLQVARNLCRTLDPRQDDFVLALAHAWDFTADEGRGELLPFVNRLCEQCPGWGGWGLRAALLELEQGRSDAARRRVATVLRDDAGDLADQREAVREVARRLAAGEVLAARKRLAAVVRRLDARRQRGRLRRP
ncbi:MAG: hypothetical protein D6731_05760 [Planctomycetota bacterium]|nr:MAG: hypothetical protein D6731_05760 [Planctomycetota bacterium]